MLYMLYVFSKNFVRQKLGALYYFRKIQPTNKGAPYFRKKTGKLTPSCEVKHEVSSVGGLYAADFGGFHFFFLVC